MAERNCAPHPGASPVPRPLKISNSIHGPTRDIDSISLRIQQERRCQSRKKHTWHGNSVMTQVINHSLGERNAPAALRDEGRRRDRLVRALFFFSLSLSTFIDRQPIMKKKKASNLNRTRPC